MSKWVKELLISSITLLILDYFYLSMTKKLFENQIALVQRVIMQIKIEGMIICYLFIIFGLNYFIIQKNRSIFDAFLLGLVIYAVYDSTNYTTLKKWNPYLATLDTFWGGTLFALTTYITYRFA